MIAEDDQTCLHAGRVAPSMTGLLSIDSLVAAIQHAERLHGGAPEGPGGTTGSVRTTGGSPMWSQPEKPADEPTNLVHELCHVTAANTPAGRLPLSLPRAARLLVAAQPPLAALQYAISGEF
jgi:hypothetical protein